MSEQITSNRIIVFFDGYCGLCSGVVDFLIARDGRRSGKRRFLYSPLQGEIAKTYLSESERTDLDTVIIVVLDHAGKEPAERLSKSKAVFRALNALGGAWAAVAMILGVLPRFLTDFGYDLIAKNRFRLMPKRETCRLPTKEERDLFLP